VRKGGGPSLGTTASRLPWPREKIQNWARPDLVPDGQKFLKTEHRVATFEGNDLNLRVLWSRTSRDGV